MGEYRVDLLPDSDPLENFRQFKHVLGELHDDELENENADVAAFQRTLADWGKNALRSTKEFHPVEQMTTLSVLNCFVGIEERHRKSLLQYPIVSRAIEYALIDEAYARAKLAKDRLPQIIGVVREVELHGVTAIYLRELGELYLGGHDIAVFLLARSALEEMSKGAIESRALESSFEEWRRKNCKEHIASLDSRLHYLRHEAVLTPELFPQADAVRIHGNWAAHDPEKLAESSVKSIDIVKRLAAVMRALGK